MTLLKDDTARVLKILFKKNDKSRRAVKSSADTAWEIYLKRASQIGDLFDGRKK